MGQILHKNLPVLQGGASVRCRHGLQMDAGMRRLPSRARRERDEWRDGLRQSLEEMSSHERAHRNSHAAVVAIDGARPTRRRGVLWRKWSPFDRGEEQREAAQVASALVY
jgi:hypothetical protein